MRNELSERLEAAVMLLTGHAPIKDRLAQVFREHLDETDGSDLPEDLQHEFQEMSRAMRCARALPGDSVISASARKLSTQDAERFSSLIVRMWARRLRGVAEPAPALRDARRAGDAPPMATLLSIEAGGPPPRSGARVSRA